MEFRRRIITLRENAAMAMETLRGNKMRSFLTVLGVFIGVVIVTAVASVLNGFRDSIVEELESFGTNNLYVYRFPFVQAGHSNRNLRGRKPLTLEDAWAIRDNCPSIAAVSPGLQYPPWLTTARARGETMEGPELRGAFPEAERVQNAIVREGRFFTTAESEHRVGVAVIGNNVAEALFPNRRAVGQKMEVVGNRVEVVGVLEKYKEGPFGEENGEDSVIMIPYGAFRKHYPWADDHFVAAEARPGKLLDAVEEVTEVLRRRRKVRWNEENDFEVGTANSIIETFDQIVFGAMAVMFLLSSVAFLVGGVGVMNIMLASVKERTAEIGMRKAIGARRRDIAWQFLVEAMALTGVGGAMGIVFTDLLALIVKASWQGLPISTPLWARIAGFSGSVSVGLLFGMWPALKAARLDPIEALRHE
ncbi:MAG TPA: ABC transporter permease [Planctomycetota bacterium]|nr:ABC transporter permease [Planctomycetota bacterium]